MQQQIFHFLYQFKYKSNRHRYYKDITSNHNTVVCQKILFLLLPLKLSINTIETSFRKSLLFSTKKKTPVEQIIYMYGISFITFVINVEQDNTFQLAWLIPRNRICYIYLLGRRCSRWCWELWRWIFHSEIWLVKQVVKINWLKQF